jgi:uncharacterized phage infection (PIP) family protein YhgE
MIAGVLGLVLSLAGLVGVWMVQPTVAGVVDSTIVTLNNSITTSQQAMEITGQALGATVDSVDALSEMLGTTAQSVEDTKPTLEQIINIMGETLPSTLASTSQSLTTAGQAADVLDGAIRSLDTFRTVLSAAPLVGAFVEAPTESYNPERSLSESLGDVAGNLDGLPDTFIEMAADLDKADDNLASIQSNLVTMSNSVGLISGSLREYQTMIGQSQASMESLRSMLTSVQDNLSTILNGIAIVLSLFFLWLLAAQVVILSQGWELYQGTAGRMESGEEKPPAAEPIAEA